LCTGTALSASVAPEEEWNRTYGEEGRYHISCGQEVEDGYILAGSFQPLNITENFEDFVLIKTDSAGNEEWNKTYGRRNSQSLFSAMQTKDGGYILAGGDEIRGLNGLVIKTDGEGVEEWNKTFGEWANDFQSVQQTSDGGYIFAGGIASPSAGGYDAWLIKTDSYGNEEWNRTFGGTSLEIAYSVQQTSDGGYILVCGIYTHDADTHTTWLIKTDSNGNEEWSKCFENPGYGYNQMNSVKETKDGGYILAGITRPSGTYKDGKAWLIKTNSEGEEEWSRTFDKGYYISLYSVQQTSDGGYVFAGNSEFSVPYRYDAWIIKTDSNGYEEWNKTFENVESSHINYVQETRDKGYILAGHRRVGVSNYLPWLIKLAGEKVPEDPLNEVRELKNYVCNLENVDNGSKTSLVVKLENSIRNLEKGETGKAVSKLEQFTDSVNKLSLHNKITADQADILVQKTQGIIELIEN